MCDVVVGSDGVRIAPTTWERTEGRAGEFLVAFSDIAQVSVSDDPTSLVHGLKEGVGLPKTKIGTWHHDGVVDYFCVHRGGPAVVLELSPGHTYARAVVTVDDPSGMADQIRSAMGAEHG